MIQNKFTANEIPYFAWDRALTTEQIIKLINFSTLQGIRHVAWIMREAAFRDAWFFITPNQVKQNFPKIVPFLGKKQHFWRYMIDEWSKMGKI